jgi:hypothetical protein
MFRAISNSISVRANYLDQFRSVRAIFERNYAYRGWDNAMCELWDSYCLELHFLKLIKDIPTIPSDFCPALAMWSLYQRNCCQADTYNPAGEIPF